MDNPAFRQTPHLGKPRNPALVTPHPPPQMPCFGASYTSSLRPLVKLVLQNPIIFMTKQKSPKQILERLFTAKNFAGSNVPCFFHLGQVAYIIQPQIPDFKRVLDLISVSKGKTQQFNFFN